MATHLPVVLPRKSAAHRLVTRIAISRLGITFLRKLGRHIDPPILRLTGGRLSSVFPFPVVLVTHTGAKSGTRRTSPLVYFTDGNRVILLASSLGSERNPSWYYNIKANPVVTLYGTGIRGSFRAEEVNVEERDRLFNLAKAGDSPYSVYEREAGTRRIPVLALSQVP